MQLILLYICVLVCIMYQGMPKSQKLSFLTNILSYLKNFRQGKNISNIQENIYCGQYGHQKQLALDKQSNASIFRNLTKNVTLCL